MQQRSAGRTRSSSRSSAPICCRAGSWCYLKAKRLLILFKRSMCDRIASKRKGARWAMNLAKFLRSLNWQSPWLPCWWHILSLIRSQVFRKPHTCTCNHIKCIKDTFHPLHVILVQECVLITIVESWVQDSMLIFQPYGNNSSGQN